MFVTVKEGWKVDCIHDCIVPNEWILALGDQQPCLYSYGKSMLGM